METDTLSTEMPKPTEETETETMTSEDLEPPLLGEMLVLHEDEEPDTDPLRTLSDTEVEAIYHKLSKSEQKVYRELLQHYWKQMHLYDKMVLTYKEVCSTMREHFPTIPSNDRDQLAKAQRRLLAEEGMRDLCKGLGYAVPEKLMTEQSTVKYDIPWPMFWFELVGPKSSDEDLPEGPATPDDQSPSMGASSVTSNRRKMRT